MQTRTALVTGSSSGIGLACAHRLAASGMNIMLHGLEDETFGQQLCEQFAQYPVKCAYHPADLSDVSQLESLITATLEHFGALDVLVNNAGIQYTAPTEQFPPEKWDQIIAINLSAAFHTTRLCLPHFQQQGFGRIVNIASVHGLVASVNKAAYCAAKHGLVGFTKVVALENAAAGITANCICPGWVDTPLLNDQIAAIAAEKNCSAEQAKHDLVVDKQAYPDLIKPDAIGDMVVFLCSDSARGINGAALPVDGAWSAQ